MVQAIRSPVQQLRLHNYHNHNNLCKAECDGNQYYYKPIPIKSNVSHPIKAKYRFYVDKKYNQTKHQSNEHPYVKEIQLLLKPKNSSFDYYNPQTSLRASFSYQHTSSPMDVSESTRTSSSSSSSPTVIKMKKRVTFNEVTEIRILPKRTIEDTLFRWYNRDDYKRFENDRKVAVHIVQQAILNRQLQQQQSSSSSSPSCLSQQQQQLALNTYLDPNLYTFVGIENHIYGKQRMFNRKLNTLRHVHSVLQQQYYNTQNKSQLYNRNLSTSNTYNYENSCNQRQYHHPPSQSYNHGPTMMYHSEDESKRYAPQTSSSSMRMMMSMHQQHQPQAPNPVLYV